MMVEGSGASKPLRVAAAQVSAGIFDPARSVEQVCDALAEAGSRGISLVVFPECFVGGYPYWRGNVSVKAETELAARLYEASIRATGPEVETIAKAAVEHGVGAVVGTDEKDDRPGSESAYNSLFFFHPEDGYVGRHRKLVPTHTERAYWARGEAEDVRTFDFPFARLGGLICYEHHMLLARVALAALGEEVHCAVWPGYWETGEHIADKRPGPAHRHGEIDATVRDYAISTQNFVVSANAYLLDADIPEDLEGILNYNLARGGSAVVDPSGRYLAGPVVGEEAIVEAELDPAARRIAKSYLDTVGHYARHDVFQLRVARGDGDQERGRSLQPDEEDRASGREARGGGATASRDTRETPALDTVRGERGPT